MALTQRLNLRQTQSLVMTPQLQQAIKLLQLSNLELAAYVEQELEQNPLLARDEGAVDGGDLVSPGTSTGSDHPSAQGEAVALETRNLAAGEGVARPEDAPLDTDYENMWNGGDDVFVAEGISAVGARSGSASSPSMGEGNLVNTVSQEVSLRDHLLRQIDADFLDPRERIIGTYLVGMLDEAGYLAGDLGEAAARLGCRAAQIEATVRRLQSLDPPGIFARDLAECLALQLRERDRLDPAMEALLANLDLLAKGDRQALKIRCGVGDEDLDDMVAEIRSLAPKPAAAFDTDVAQPITPDIFIRRQRDGGWYVELNNETLPRVLVDNQYYARISAAARSKEEQEYLTDRLQAANWLVKSLHQRATTILRVATEIVRQQEAFFSRGIKHLRPLILRDIASVLDLHESTVSRVTTNKYMATPRGIFELKYFFGAAISGIDDGASHSGAAVRHRIKALIEGESDDNILSDDAIVEALRREGIEIARRTVAKYREALRIPSSVQRRRKKKQKL